MAEWDAGADFTAWKRMCRLRVPACRHVPERLMRCSARMPSQTRGQQRSCRREGGTASGSALVCCCLCRLAAALALYAALASRTRPPTTCGSSIRVARASMHAYLMAEPPSSLGGRLRVQALLRGKRRAARRPSRAQHPTRARRGVRAKSKLKLASRHGEIARQERKLRCSGMLVFALLFSRQTRSWRLAFGAVRVSSAPQSSACALDTLDCSSLCCSCNRTRRNDDDGWTRSVRKKWDEMRMLQTRASSLVGVAPPSLGTALGLCAPTHYAASSPAPWCAQSTTRRGTQP